LRQRDDDAFWPSYVDLMTSLFVVVLMLFVFSFAAYSITRINLQREMNSYRVRAENYNRLQNIDAAIAGLANKNEFEYQKEYKRYVFREEVHFDRGVSTIDPSYDDFLLRSGRAITNLVATLRADPAKRGIKYLVIIEGMASRDNYKDNFALSYRRAYALYAFWNDHKIGFDKDVCEVIIAGSGTDGVGRYPSAQEARNQRFLIQIIPKVAYEN
jgi:outer membrane protein OmpA-like peptidoglycan-associated protein